MNDDSADLRDPTHNILPRPEAAAEHDRFFEDGEEPPARYDLPDPLDYIEVNPEPIDSARWRSFGKALGWKQRELFRPRVYYYLGASILGSLLGVLPYLILLAPAIHGVITGFSLALLTGNWTRFGVYSLNRRRIASLALANLPAFITQIWALIGLYMTGVLLYFALEVLVNSYFGRDSKVPTGFGMMSFPYFLIVGLLLVGIHVIVTVRACGFATHLILDYGLSPNEAIRANWRITRGRTWQLIRLKLRLWLLKYLVAFLTCGFGLLLYEPYTSAVWTAAYLDIAGSEPPREVETNTFE